MKHSKASASHAGRRPKSKGGQIVKEKKRTRKIQ